MSASVHAFPRRYRPPADASPDDARPIGRQRTAFVSPDSDSTWSCTLVDDGGGMLLIGNATKRTALYTAVEAVLTFNAEMMLRNDWPSR